MARPELDFSRLRSLREERGWSLRRLATASDVSPSYLSLVERGRVVPTLNRILRVCEALGVSLGDFTSADGEPTIVPSAQLVSTTFHESHARVTILASATTSQVSMFLFEIEPETHPPERMIVHSYPEYGFLIRGSLKIVFENEEAFARAGDSVRVEAGRAHRFINPGAGLSTSVWAAPAL